MYDLLIGGACTNRIARSRPARSVVFLAPLGASIHVCRIGSSTSRMARAFSTWYGEGVSAHVAPFSSRIKPRMSKPVTVSVAIAGLQNIDDSLVVLGVGSRALDRPAFLREP